MAVHHRPISASSRDLPRGPGREILLAANRKNAKFQVPLCLSVAAFLTAASTQPPQPGGLPPYAFAGPGGAVVEAAPRYIPMEIPAYQETDVPSATPTETAVPTETETPTPTETLVIGLTPTLFETPTDTPAPTETETSAPTETATPEATPTETSTPTQPFVREDIGVPDNDNINNAFAVTLPSYAPSINDTTDASIAPGDPMLSCGYLPPSQQYATVWYSLTTTTHRTIVISTAGSDYDTVIAVWSGPSDDLVEVDCADTPSSTESMTVSLLPGSYYIEVAESGADLPGGNLDFEVNTIPLQGLVANYYAGRELPEPPVYTGMDQNVDFDWTGLSPAPGIATEDFSVRWTGRVHPQYSETYTFYVASDDGVSLWVDGQQLIDAFTYYEEPGGVIQYQGNIALQAGQAYAIELIYQQWIGTSVVQLGWSSASLAQEIIPASALDYIDVANSTVGALPSSVSADGVSTSTVTVTVMDSQSNYLAGIPVYLQVSGAGNRINGYAPDPGEWVYIGDSNGSGQAAAVVSSTAVGLKTVSAMAGGMLIGSTANIDFTQNGPVSRLSVSHVPGNEGAEADAESTYPSISDDGNFVAFLSAATNLAEPPDTGPLADVFVLDRGTNTLTPAIFATENGYPDADLMQPQISGNGAYVVFASSSTNLDSNCASGIQSIFVYQVQVGGPGTFACVSRGLLNNPPDGPSEHPSISYDGRYVVFASYATNLVSGVSVVQKHVYLADMLDPANPVIEMISWDSDEVIGNDVSDYPAVSSDGNLVVFQSYATNLIAADGNSASDIFLRDRSLGTTVRVSTALVDPDPSGASFYPTISNDGTRVAFISNAANMVPETTGGIWNVFLRDVSASTTELISRSVTSGFGGNADSLYSRISADGNHVIFGSYATDLLAGGSSGSNQQMYVRDLEDSTTVKVSVAAGGEEANASSDAAALSANGTVFVFQSLGSNLVAGDTLGLADIFLTERITPVLPPANDDFSAPTAVSLPSNTYNQGTAGATWDSDDPFIDCAGSPSRHNNSVWYSIDPLDDGSISLSTAGSSYDTVLAVWTGTRGALTNVACDDDSSGLQSSLIFYANVGTTYWVEIVQKGTVPGGGNLTFAAQEVTIAPVTVYVHDTGGNPEILRTVDVYMGETYTGTSDTTDNDGFVTFTLPENTYRFRVVKNGTEFWSEDCNTLTCSSADVETTIPVTIAVRDRNELEQEGMWVVAFEESTGNTHIVSVTNSGGWTQMTLPRGNYRFRTEKNNRAFWSDTVYSCIIPDCESATIYIDYSVTVHVADTLLDPDAGVWVRAYVDGSPTDYFTLTDGDGNAYFSLPNAVYTFRANKGGTFFPSLASCDVNAACVSADILTNVSVTVTVLNAAGAAESGILVHAFSEASGFTNLSFTTDASGQAVFTLPDGNYRFRADKGARMYWSSETFDCDVGPEGTCYARTVNVYSSVSVHVQNTSGMGRSGLWVRAYSIDPLTSTNYFAQTNAGGDAVIDVPAGTYRISANQSGTFFWSADCNVSTGCENATIVTNLSTSVYVYDGFGAAQQGVWVYAFSEAAGFVNLAVQTDVNGRARFYLNDGNYRFRADRNGKSYWSAATFDCSVPGCTSRNITIFNPVDITVRDANDQPDIGVWVRAYDSVGMTNYFALTDSDGVARVYLPNGTYYFNASKSGMYFWSNGSPDCEVPTCTAAYIGTNPSITVTVTDTTGAPAPGLQVYAFEQVNGNSGQSFTTDASGQVSFTLGAGNYRFRADKGSRMYWSSAMYDCEMGVCTADDIQVYTSVTVTVADTSPAPDTGIWVRAFTAGPTSTNYFAATNSGGVAVVDVPNGTYSFGANKAGTFFWSADCVVSPVSPCTSTSITTNVPTTVSVTNLSSEPEQYMWVHAFTGSGYAGVSVQTGIDGLASFILPDGVYRFRADKLNRVYWSSETPDCAVPGCTGDTIGTDDSVTVIVKDSYGTADVGLNVQAYEEVGGYTGVSGITNAQGQAILILGAGHYRFRTTKNGTVFWSTTLYNCTIPNGCPEEYRTITTTQPVLVSVHTQGDDPEIGITVHVYRYDDATEWASGVTDENGDVYFTLNFGGYAFMVVKNSTEYWNGPRGNCSLPGCTQAFITTDAGGFAAFRDDFRGIVPARFAAQGAPSSPAAASGEPAGGGREAGLLFAAFPLILGDGLLHWKRKGRPRK
jgi:hypothetical protein